MQQPIAGSSIEYSPGAAGGDPERWPDAHHGSVQQITTGGSAVNNRRAGGLDDSAEPRDGAASRPRRRLCLLARFRLGDADGQRQLCPASQRLLALLAFRPAGAERDLVAGLLWPDVSEDCAHACLRSALHRLAQSAPFAVRASGRDLSLAEGLEVDLHIGQLLAIRLLQPRLQTDLNAAVAGMPLLSAELLPGWYEDWVQLEAERWRQLRLHALEALVGALRERRRFGEACLAAAAAIAADPLRESPRAAMIRIHLSEGNRSEAVREFERYGSLVRRNLGCEPTEQLRRLLSVS